VCDGAGSVSRAEQILLSAALAMLLVSAGLGAGAAHLSHGALRAHVRAGSVGWMTLAVLAIALGMVNAGREDVGPWQRRARRIAIPLSLVVAATVVGCLAVSLAAGANAWTGPAALAAILAFLALLAALDRAARAVETVPGLGMAGALAVLAVGSALGVSSAGIAVPFVVLATTSIVEWSASPTARPAPPTTAGLVQVGALVLAAAAVIAGVRTHDLTLVESNIPLEIGGIAIFLARLSSGLLAAGWAQSERVWLVTSTVALAADVGLFAHVVFEIGNRRYVSINTVPRWLLFAVDHVTFVAVGTPALFGAIAALAGQESRWPRADALAAAGLVLGLAAAVAATAADSAVLEGLSAAVLGISLLAAVVLAGQRMLAITERRCPHQGRGSLR